MKRTTLRSHFPAYLLAASLALSLTAAGQAAPPAAAYRHGSTFSLAARSVLVGHNTVTVTALDPNYTGTIPVRCNSGCSVIGPPTVTLVQGTGQISLLVPRLVSTVTLVLGRRPHQVPVEPVTLHLVGVPAQSPPGAAIAFTIQAQDSHAAVLSSYTGTLVFTCAGGDQCPGATTITAGQTAALSATLKAVPSDTIRVNDQDFPDIAGSATVAIGTASPFTIAPSALVVGKQTLTLTAPDATYNGQIPTVACSPNCLVTTPPTSFTNNTSTVGISVQTAGPVTITVNGATSQMNAGQITLAFLPAPLPTTATQGSSLTLTLAAVDANGHTVNSYSGIVTFTCGALDKCPSQATVTNGTAQVTFPISTVPKDTITAQDNAFPSIVSPALVLTVAPGSPMYNGGEILRLAVGATDNFSPSTQPAGKLYLNFSFENGIGGTGVVPPTSSGSLPTINLGSPLRFWFDASVFGNASSTSSLISGGTALASSLSLTSAATLGSTAQSIIETAQLRGGLAIRILQSPYALAGIPRDEAGVTTIELIAGLGGETPTAPAPTSTTPLIYCANGPSTTAPNGCAPPPNATSPTFDAIYPAVRDRFYTSWEAGLRFHTYYLPDASGNPVLPSSLDLTVGENEAVTEGTLRGAVMHFEAFLPMPNDWDWIYLIFSGDFQLPHDASAYLSPPLSLANPQPGGPYPSPMYATSTAMPIRADALRIGIAFDLIDLVENHLPLKFK